MNEKKFSRGMAVVYLLITACLIVGIVLFTSQDSGSKQTITVDGFMGPLTVEVSFDENGITNAKVVEYTEGEFVAQSADTIFAQAIANGNADNIDIVAGASATSKALISAMQEAAKQAGMIGVKHTITTQGFMGPLTVQVTIDKGAVIDAKVLEFTEGEFIAQSADAIFSQAIANGNADDIDIIAGASATSKALITAMQEAQVAAGIGENVYTATADGRAGPISIAVTIIDGKITGAIVTDYPTGERIPESADTIIAKAIENGDPNEIDVVAGASMTSRGLISALQLAYTEATNE